MDIQIEQVKAILFDIDGTLSDSDDLLVQKVERVLKPFTFYFSQEKRRAFSRWLVMTAESPGNFIYNLADRFDLDSLFIRTLNRLSMKKKRRIKRYRIIPGSTELLTQLSGTYPLGVVSARDEISAMAFIKHFDLEKHFCVIVTSQTCRYTKPFPDPLLFAADKLGIEPHNCLMVGDTTVDMKAAKLAGMQAVGVLCGFGHKKELKRAGADVILPATTDLLQLILSHNK
ncbi:MAG: HAD family hydrolase [Pelolinea sp.]|nr:HAD family hydrolase [Pelolinea sp.]